MNVSIIGLGRVGLPAAVVAADSGHRVIGIDASPYVVGAIRSGSAQFFEPELNDILRRHLGGRLLVTTELEAAADTEIIVVMVGTPLDGGPRRVSEKPLFELVDRLASVGIRDKTLVLRTTVPLGLTERIASHLQDRHKLRSGESIHLAYCPERMAEGRAISEERSLPKVIGALDEIAYTACLELFEPFGGPCIRVAGPRTAELVKHVDNAYRATMFAFSLDLARLADEQGVAAHEVIRAANQGYPRNAIPMPSCGVSGYCLSKDPYMLEISFDAIAQNRGSHSIWYHARLNSEAMPVYTARRALDFARAAHGGGKPVIALAGLAFKADVDDTRFSHAFDIATALLEGGATVVGYDPFWSPEHPYMQLAPSLRGAVAMRPTLQAATDGADAVVFTVGHRAFRTEPVEGWLEHMRQRIVIDGAMLFEREDLPADVTFWSVGWGLCGS